MKRMILAGAVVAATIPHGAADPVFRGKVEMLEMKCNAEAEFAASVMRLRQAGASKTVALSNDLSEGLRAIVDAAYKAPQRKSVAAFADEVNIACYRREIKERR